MNQNLSQNVKIIQRGVHKYMSRYDLNKIKKKHWNSACLKWDEERERERESTKMKWKFIRRK